MDVHIIECGNPKTHGEHSWREGFLWHRKRDCKGVPLHFYKNRPPKHRHEFKTMTPVHDHTSSVSFICWKTGCKAQVSMYRHQLKEVLMENRPFESCYIRYKETW